jgi:hypothetical protein
MALGIGGLVLSGAEPFAPARPAATSQPAAPGVSNILQRAVAALGDRTVLEQARTFRALGSAEAAHLGESVACELCGEVPGRRALMLQAPGQGRVREVFDGERGWYEDPVFGRTDWTGEELAKRRRDATFLRERHLARLHPDLRFKGVESVENEPCDILESRPATEGFERYAFSRKTGLLVRQESRFLGALGPIQRSVSFGDYRAADGIQFPHRMSYRQRGGSQAEPEVTIQIRFREVKFNVALPAGVFQRPGDP